MHGYNNFNIICDGKICTEFKESNIDMTKRVSGENHPILVWVNILCLCHSYTALSQFIQIGYHGYRGWWCI